MASTLAERPGRAAREHRPAPAAPPGRTRRRAPNGPYRLTATSGLGLGVALVWFSALALVPLVAVLVETSVGGWPAFVAAVTQPQTAAALTLTVTQALAVTAVNVVMGTLIAWVLVRDRFPGKRLLEVLIDIPFALPTIVAGLVLLAVRAVGTAGDRRREHPRRRLPRVPVRHAALRGAQRAARARRAGPGRRGGRRVAGRHAATTFRRVVLPALAPAITAGAALSFARAISEYGALVLLSGNLPMRTEVGSVRILSYLENGQPEQAAAVASVLLLVSLLVIATIQLLQRRVARRG